MINRNTANSPREFSPEHTDAAAPVYSREAFRAILARQPEWKIRTALEEGNIPSSNIDDAIEWLDELENANRHRASLS